MSQYRYMFGHVHDWMNKPKDLWVDVYAAWQDAPIGPEHCFVYDTEGNLIKVIDCTRWYNPVRELSFGSYERTLRKLVADKMNGGSDDQAII